MKKRLFSPLPALLLLLLPLLLVAADPTATHLLYLDSGGHPLQDIDLAGGHFVGTLPANRLPAALNPVAITASGANLSLRATAPHERFLQLTDPLASTEFLTLDTLGDHSPAFNLRSAPSLRVRTEAANLFTVWASGGVSVGSSPWDPGVGSLAISQNFSAAGNVSVAGALSVSGPTTFDDGNINTDGSGNMSVYNLQAAIGGFSSLNCDYISTTWISSFDILYFTPPGGCSFTGPATFDTNSSTRALTVANGVNVGGSSDPGTGNLAVAGTATLAPRSSAPSAPSGGVTLYVDSSGDLHALHANGTNHVLSAH